MRGETARDSRELIRPHSSRGSAANSPGGLPHTAFTALISPAAQAIAPRTCGREVRGGGGVGGATQV